MTTRAPLDYAVVSPVMNEVDNLARLASSLASQTLQPAVWVVVDTGSTDATPALVQDLQSHHDWIVAMPFEQAYARGGPIVRAFQAGVAALPKPAGVVVKVDADISVEPGYFEELLRRFERDPKLGIASGTCLELEDGEWRERHVTGDHVWGACRAYRAECLADVMPLEERMGWDGIDAFKATARGWHTATFRDLPFRHHRREGARDGRWRAWAARGRAAHFMGYRPSFLLIRALNRIRRDPVAVAMVVGWAQAAVHREPRCSDTGALEVLRTQQRLRNIPLRALESLGRRSGRRPAV